VIGALALSDFAGGLGQEWGLLTPFLTLRIDCSCICPEWPSPRGIGGSVLDL